MLTDPEERRRLRQEKAAQRQQRQNQLKRLLIRLSVAAVILIACGVLIFCLTRDALSGSPSAEQTLPTETGIQQEETLPPTTVIHYAAAGDLNINDKTVGTGVYYDTFLDVAHLLARADVTSVNFEGTLCGAPYGSTFSAPQALAEALKTAGVDLVQMANSYSINKGLSGLATSIDAVRAAGMEPLGVYASNAEFNQRKGYTLCTVDGVKLAFVAFTKGMDGMTLPAGGEHCVNVLYTDYDSSYQEVDTEGITSILAAAAKEKPDLVIALLHWGSEFNDTISSSQEKIVSLLQKNGVDAIIGTHSHYVQKIELDEETGRFVAYSLGDFFSDGQRAGTEYSVILDLEITKDNLTGETRITDYSYTPIFTVHEENQPLRVMRINEAVSAYQNNFISKVSLDTYNQMLYALGRIEARVAGE